MRVIPVSPAVVLLLLFSSTASSHISPRNPASNAGHDDALSEKEIQHDTEIKQKKHVHQPPVGVRKLSDDEGEKFWLDYWQFVDDVAVPAGEESPHCNEERGDTNTVSWNNDTLLHAPYALHANGEAVSYPRWIPRGFLSPLTKRSFECPARTSPCTSINRPNSCCGDGSTCQILKDTGLGDVGCCPRGDKNCSGGLTSCGKGLTSCPNHPGGGCCIPGYSCVDEGCMLTVTTTTTVTVPASSPSSFSSEIPTTTTIPPPPQSSASIDPPWRPTSNPTMTTTSTTSNTVDTSPSPTPTETYGCPTGFYACEAVYHGGGCCRTGRDCNPTSCPVISSTTTVNSNGATIVVPVTTGAGSTAGSCASGWTSCPDAVGGGCCPVGYECGETSCQASAGGEQTDSVEKMPAENGGGKGLEVKWRIPSFLSSMVLFIFLS